MRPTFYAHLYQGTMTFRAPGKEGARVHDLKDVEAILDVFLQHGHREIDSARTYCGGTSEEYLGQINWQEKGLLIETKLAPRVGITHSPEDLRKHLTASLTALNAKTLEMWYLHAPDRSVPYEVTLKAVNDLHQEGYFKRFGISNFASWEVAEIVGICKANGYIQPTAYQGIYNAIHRAVEPELLPCLRKFGISFYEFNPLAGGFFTDRYSSLDDKPEAGSRFDPERNQGQNYRNRYWNEPYFKALNQIRPVVEKHKLTMAEVALRWISHHSLLKREYRDAVLIGASSLEHIEQNLLDLEKGPLPDEVVQILVEAWTSVKPFSTKYHK
ncbi:Aldo/keto reductase [Mycena albidolilacea]|uniref:Aldo/keto reductase n=1 Tax=Mycena albidolilacea TaxID=1033008 RepID=A0AAD6ZXS2_9AGAR|nr:Aldo/keto reductase [Mycena albidolilacea]